ncbi:sphingomyelinase C [Abditibacteriota bacterium]|nr:sphingomyelinase C [Abditibacteriota bacterium]
MSKLKMVLLAFLLLGMARLGVADTYVYVQNNTPFHFDVQINQPAGLDLPPTYWRRGVAAIEPGQRVKLYQTNRDEGVKNGRYYEFHCRLNPLGGSSFGLNQRLKGTPFFSDLWQSVDGDPWYSDHNTHNRTWNTGQNQFNVKYRAYFTGGADDIEYILQYKYPVATGDAHTLNMVSYNTYMRPTSIFVNGQSIRQQKMMPEIKGSGYDVVLFSEMFDDDIRNRTIADLRSEFPFATNVVGHDDGLDQDGGVILFSKWPIITQDQRVFGSACSGSDCMADKGVIYACINKNGQIYHVFGTHTQADKGNADRSARRQQFQIMKAFIDSKHIPAAEPVLIGGDLNVDMTRSQAEYLDMLSILHATHPGRPAPVSFTATWDPTINKCADAGTPEFLDYILYSNDHLHATTSLNEVRLLRAAEEWKTLPTDKARWDLSDHFAVFGNFTFPRFIIQRPTLIPPGILSPSTKPLIPKEP